MTKEEQKAKAVELIEKHEALIYEKLTYTDDGVEVIALAKSEATLECQSIIDELELNNDGDVNFVGSLDERITFYKGVIKAIEQQ